MNSKTLNGTAEIAQTQNQKHRPNHGNPDGFIPCPFCGAVPHIRVEDDEGNNKTWDEEYEYNPWSGLWYVIEHTKDGDPEREDNPTLGDIPHDVDCLIATEGPDWYGFDDVPHIGGDTAVFTTRKAAVKWWNKMVRKYSKQSCSKSEIGLKSIIKHWHISK